MDTTLAGIGDNSGGLSQAEQIAQNVREKHPDLVKRSAELAGMLERAPTEATDEDTANKISEAVRQCTAFLKSAEATRVEDKEPYLAGGRAVDGAFKTLTDPVAKTKQALERVRTAYDIRVEEAERERLRKEAEEARKKAEKIAADANTAAGQERAAVAAQVAEEAQQAVKATSADLTRTRTDSGVTTSLRSEWRFEITEAKKVPKKYLVPSEALIKAAIKAATTKDGECPLEIAGVRIYKHRFSQVR